MAIRQLSAETINRIAAGEVVERPASVVKELVENALDAGAREIEVVTAAGGLSLIRVTDDGKGMDADDLALCVDRHATSKLEDDDLLAIRTLGFRGEALPSIGAIAHLAIASRPRAARDALEIIVDRGVKLPIKPAALNPGTRIEVRELFSATPARLKFLKSERSENLAVSETVKRLAMAHPGVGFSLTMGERVGLRLPPTSEAPEGMLQRLGRIMGAEFLRDAVPVQGERDGITVRGFAGLPTLHRPDAAQQFLFVNGRPIRDKLVIGAVRAAYGDTVPRGRHPLLALFVEVDPSEVDVNVHPAKVEVRFQNSATVRSLLIGALRHAIENRRFPRERSGRRPHPRNVGPHRELHNADVLPAATLVAIHACRLRGAAQDSVRRLGYPHRKHRRARRSRDPRSRSPSPARRCPRTAARNLHRRADRDVRRDCRPARGARTPRLRTSEAHAGERRHRAPRGLLIPAVIEVGEDEALALEDKAGELAELGSCIGAFRAGRRSRSRGPGPAGHHRNRRAR